jgi:ABC-type nitrate/sulfonate/bicarbonate transport system permease component
MELLEAIGISLTYTIVGLAIAHLFGLTHWLAHWVDNTK